MGDHVSHQVSDGRLLSWLRHEQGLAVGTASGLGRGVGVSSAVLASGPWRGAVPAAGTASGGAVPLGDWADLRPVPCGVRRPPADAWEYDRGVPASGGAFFEIAGYRTIEAKRKE